MLRRLAWVALVGAVLHTNALAQEYPTRPITVLVGLAAGGVTDVMARVYAEAVSRVLNQRVIVENRPTGSGAVAAAALQTARPDGYTLLVFAGAQHGTVPAIEKVSPYDPINGNQPIALLFATANVLVVPANSPANSLAELTAFAKARPGGLNFGSPGLGSPSYLTGAKILAATNTPAQVVHYRGGPPMIADLLPGRLDAVVTATATGKPYLIDKKLKALVIDSTERWSVLPEVPTLRELGIGDAAVATWFGVAAPPGTPQPIIEKLHAAFSAASRDPQLRQRMADGGMTVVTSSPEEMARLLAKEVADIAQLVRTLGLVKQ